MPSVPLLHLRKMAIAWCAVRLAPAARTASTNCALVTLPPWRSAAPSSECEIVERPAEAQRCQEDSGGGCQHTGAHQSAAHRATTGGAGSARTCQLRLEGSKGRRGVCHLEHVPVVVHILERELIGSQQLEDAAVHSQERPHKQVRLEVPLLSRSGFSAD